MIVGFVSRDEAPVWQTLKKFGALPLLPHISTCPSVVSAIRMERLADIALIALLLLTNLGVGPPDAVEPSLLLLPHARTWLSAYKAKVLFAPKEVLKTFPTGAISGQETEVDEDEGIGPSSFFLL